MPCSITRYLEKALKEQTDNNSKPKKYEKGFEPTTLRQNAIALPIVPPPLPDWMLVFSLTIPAVMCP